VATAALGKVGSGAAVVGVALAIGDGVVAGTAVDWDGEGTARVGRAVDRGVGVGVTAVIGGSVMRGVEVGAGAAIVGVGVGDGRGAGVSGGGPIIVGVGVGAGCRRKSDTCAAAGAASKAAVPARRKARRFISVRVPALGGRGVNSR
jgi:hypothetical protein